MTCDLCRRDTGELNFNLVCCRVRYLMRMSSRKARADWLDRWATQLPKARLDEIKNELVARFGKKRNEK